MVGALSLFFLPAPLLMKQGYLVITGVAVAYVFTWIPEWTTWILLVAMALYDIIAGGELLLKAEGEDREAVACMEDGCRGLGRLCWGRGATSVCMLRCPAWGRSLT